MNFEVTAWCSGEETSHSPVRLESMSPGSLTMWPLVDGLAGRNVSAVRVMENVWHVTFHVGHIEIEGVESNNGTLVQSRWEAVPLGRTPQEDALLREVFGE
jgi:hypothetical protein